MHILCTYYCSLFYTSETVCIIKLNENLNQLSNWKYFILNLLIGYIIIIKTHFINYYRPNYLIIHSDTLLHDLFFCASFFSKWNKLQPNEPKPRVYFHNGFYLYWIKTVRIRSKTRMWIRGKFLKQKMSSEFLMEVLLPTFLGLRSR